MSPKPLILLVLLAVIPMTAIAWLGFRMSRSDAARVEQAYRAVLQQRLDEEEQRLSGYFVEVRRELSQLADETGTTVESLRNLVRQHPLIRQTIVLDAEGFLVHPSSQAPRSNAESAFLIEIEQLLADKDLARLAFPAAARRQQPSPRQSSKSSAPTPMSRSSSPPQPQPPTTGESDGWYAWYFGRGINLMYWRRMSEDRILVFALSRSRWMADLLNRMPTTSAILDQKSERRNGTDDSGNDLAAWRICLTDAANQTIYQWGRLPANENQQPLVETPVTPPLNAWRLKYFVNRQNYEVSQLPVITGVTSVALALAGLALFLYREFSRTAREASQRVNFVNQVSHELKTPLTNIRMYADLLEMDLEQIDARDAEKPRSRLDVIISESQRLTRLITNVLTFARADRKQLKLNCSPTSIDDIVCRVIDRFRPGLAAKQIEIELALNAPSPAMIDGDIVEQIVGNLVSNAERYASEGRWLGVSTQKEANGTLTVVVKDHGSGIQDQLQQKIFEPFYRVSNRLSDSNGTGIGLSISRQLARLHGGDLIVEQSEAGAAFRLTLAEGENRRAESIPKSDQHVAQAAINGDKRGD